MNNKLIYKPKKNTPASEYSKYAVSFFEGCTEIKCKYCYMQAMSKRFNKYFEIARLKPWLISEMNAIVKFIKEVENLIPELQKYGLFFNFSSDPFLPQAIDLNIKAWKICENYKIPIYVLTKQKYPLKGKENILPKNVIISVTLTGRDDLEKGASTNIQRINTLKRFHELGYKTFVSIEPIINFALSLDMIILSAEYCDLFKIGLESGKKYNKQKLFVFFNSVFAIIHKTNKKVYFKDSLLKQLGIERKDLKHTAFVNSDYKLFN